MIMPAWFYSIIGAVIGSFLNVIIDRLPEGESIINPPSHCPYCQHRIAAYDLIPVISFLLLRGRCRSCRKKIPLRVLAVELLTGITFWLIWLEFGQGWEAVLISLYTAILITIAFIDLEHQRVPNLLIYPAIGIGLIASPLINADSWWSPFAGAGLGFILLFLITVAAPGAMGMGDVKLMIFLGLVIGFPEVALALLLAFVLGGIIAGTLLILKKVDRKDAIAFGPYLSLAGFIVLLYGGEIIGWWIRMVNR